MNVLIVGKILPLILFDNVVNNVYVNAVMKICLKKY